MIDRVIREREGANAGLNPMFGEWQNTFQFAPVPFGRMEDGAKRQAFRESIQSALNNRWVYSHEIHLEITLHLDVQAILETSDTADLDNYAKNILDGLKGPNGIMFDDTQVQALTISWLDGYGDPSFTVNAKGSPDEFLLKPVEFYEMPDGLWYPHSRFVWSDGGKEALNDRNHFAGLAILEMMSSIKRRARAEMRNAGLDRLRAYQQSKYVSSSARGFHRSRLDDGFPAHPRREWQDERRKWTETNPGEIEPINEIIAKARASYEGMIDVLSGRLTSSKNPRP
jgi:hypothetical protein